MVIGVVCREFGRHFELGARTTTARPAGQPPGSALARGRGHGKRDTRPTLCIGHHPGRGRSRRAGGANAGSRSHNDQGPNGLRPASIMTQPEHTGTHWQPRQVLPALPPLRVFPDEAEGRRSGTGEARRLRCLARAVCSRLAGAGACRCRGSRCRPEGRRASARLPPVSGAVRYPCLPAAHGPCTEIMATPAGFEPATIGLEGRCSIH